MVDTETDGALVAITLMIAESDPKEKDIMTMMVMNLLTVQLEDTDLLEFKKFSDFPRGTMYDILCDAYSYDYRFCRQSYTTISCSIIPKQI